jgi:hypothetical protein
MLRLGEKVTSDDRSFHIEAPVTGNARSRSRNLETVRRR